MAAREVVTALCLSPHDPGELALQPIDQRPELLVIDLRVVGVARKSRTAAPSLSSSGSM
jgi:hypothetical protein